jgi:large subunit ribosomal protein L21
VVEIGGHQYKVKAGDLIDVQKLDQENGSTVELEKVLFVVGEKTLVGAPTVKGAKVTAKIVKQDRDRKIIVFKRKPGGYKRKQGHRQHYTALLITELNDGNGKTSKIDPKSKLAEKYLK